MSYGARRFQFVLRFVDFKAYIYCKAKTWNFEILALLALHDSL